MLVIKAARGTLPAGKEIAAAVMRIFAAQKQHADAGKEKFGDWNSRMANALEPLLFDLYVRSAGKSARKVGVRFDEQELVAELKTRAKVRSIELARDLNSTTSDWVQEGRDSSSVFGVDRAAQTALTEASRAHHDGQLATMEAVGITKTTWRTNKKATVCPQCMSLDGKSLAVGKDYVSKGGLRAKAPPLHPKCFCTLEPQI